MRTSLPRPLGRGLRLLLALAVAALLLAGDVASKQWADTELRTRGARGLVGTTLVLRYGFNRGLAFGLWKGHLHPKKEVLFLAYSAASTAVIALLLLVRGLSRDQAPRPVITAGLTLLLAGSAGNLWDRYRRGGVVDFIVVGRGESSWPAFNLADVYLGAGLILCAFGLVRLATSGRGLR